MRDNGHSNRRQHHYKSSQRTVQLVPCRCSLTPISYTSPFRTTQKMCLICNGTGQVVIPHTDKWLVYRMKLANGTIV